MRRDPVVVLHECADLVPGTAAATRMRELARSASSGVGEDVICGALRNSVEMPWYYNSDGRAALALAAEEIAK